MLHQLEGRTRELNRLAAEIARDVADSAGRPVVVAGSVGPTGDLLAPLGPLSEDEAVEVFVEQIEGLREGGADVAWIETMSAPEEMRAAARAASKCGMPYTLTASFDTAGRTMMGSRPPRSAICPGARPGAGRLRRQLRRRRLRPPGGDPWHGARRAADRQGQRRRAAMAWGGDPLFRHAGADGAIRRAWPPIAARASSAAAAATRPPMSRRCGAGSTPTSPARARRGDDRRGARSARRAARSGDRR